MRDVYDEWVFDTFGVDPSTYPPLPPPPPGGEAGLSSPATDGVSAGDDVAARKVLVGKMVHGSKSATPADLALVADHVAASIPLQDLKAINRSGVTFEATQGDVTSAIPMLATMHPRDYPAGSTWTGRPAMYYPATKQVIVATQAAPNGGRALPGLALSDCADVLVHETGHALNRTPMFTNLSDSDKFKAAYSQPMKGRLSDQYYHQDDDVSAGRDEAAAESYAMFLTTPDRLKADAPALYAFWEARYAH